MATINGIDPGSYVSPVTVPVPGAEVKSNDVVVAAQALANQTKYLDVRTTAIEAVNAAQAATLDVYRGAVGSQFFPFVAVEGGNANMWDFSRTTVGVWTQASVTGTNVGLLAPITVPTGTQIGTVIVYVDSSGHGASSPSILPAVYLLRTGTATGAAVFSVSDTFVGYDTPHGIPYVLSPVETIDNQNYAYVVKFYGEYSTNAIAGALKVFGVKVLFTPIA